MRFRGVIGKTLLLALAVAGLGPAAAGADLTRVGSEVAISGRVADIAHYASVSGYRFRVALSGLQYSGRVDRTLVERNGDEATIWIALRDVGLTIGRTRISGRPGGALCGPLEIRMGHRRDLWVALDLRRDEDQGLTLRKTRFALPGDNWSIGRPAWVRTSGFGVTRERVTSGLHRGILRNKDRIERELIEAAPGILLAAAFPDAGEKGKRTVAEALDVLLSRAERGSGPGLEVAASAD